MDGVRSLWLLYVTDGQGLENGPELYRGLERALFEGQRFAERLAGLAETSIEHVSTLLWRVGHRDVRLEEVEGIPGVEPWVGFRIDGTGYPIARAVLLPGRSAAARWVSAPTDSLGSLSLVSLVKAGWCIRSTWLGDERLELIAERAKEICDDLARHR